MTITPQVYCIAENPMDKEIASPTPAVPDLPCLAQFAEYLRHRECSPLTVKNYLTDLRAFAR